MPGWFYPSTTLSYPNHGSFLSQAQLSIIFVMAMQELRKGTNKKIPRVKLNFLKTFFCTKIAIFLLYCDCLNCSLRNSLVKYGNQCILHEKKGFQNIILTLSIILLVHRGLKFAVCTLISLWVTRKWSRHPLR